MAEGRRDPGDVARARVRLVRRAHEAASDDAGRLTVPTPAGAVEIEALDAVESGAGSYVEVTVSGAADPLFRIVNPPTLVPDPTGDRVVNGVTYREDPIAAIAYVIAQHGGAQEKQKDARKGRR